MRIISFVVCVTIFTSTIIFLSDVTQGQETTNETKINFEKSVELNKKLAEEGFDIQYAAPYNFDGYEKVQKRTYYFNAGQVSTAHLPKGQFTITATAYTAAADECGKSDGITASGAKVKANHTIAAPPQFPFGTKIRIEGMGVYVCEDRGGAIKGNHFDIYMETKPEAFAFGRRTLVAEIVS